MLCNMLIDNLPTVTPNGYTIDTNFKTAIKFELLMQDNRLTAEEKLPLALSLFFNEIDVDKVEEQLEAALWFYCCGKNEKLEIQEENRQEEKQIIKESIKQIYHFEFDDNYIFSSFMQQYKIDLTQIDYMHWWKFKALFESLTKETKIVEIMGYRGVNLSELKNDKSTYNFYRKMQRIYALPDMRSKDEKEADFGKAFW